MMKDKKQNLKRLADEIFSHDRKYYIDAKPSIGDRDYDKMKDTYRALVDKYGFDIDKSPLSTVGDSLGQTGGKRVSHVIPMLSLDNTYNREELEKWITAKMKIIMEAKFTPKLVMSVEPKIDGVSMSILYDEDGNFKRLATRGDGRVGEDISHLAPYIDGIPMKDVNTAFSEVRGEGVIYKADFLAINEQMEKEKGRTYRNPRNLTGGSLSLKDIEKFKKRKVRFIAFDAICREDIDQEKRFSLIAMSGFNYAKNFNSVDGGDMVSLMCGMKDDFPYEIDGIVFKYTQPEVREILGTGTKAPKWAVAYKFEEDAVATKLNDVTWHVGTRGKVTPVAQLEPVMIKGSRISKATLHNWDEIIRLGININDIVSVIKSAAVIPKVLGVNKRSDDGVEINIPHLCPSCNKVLQKVGPNLMCHNLDCPAKNLRVLMKFASRDAMDISGLGEGALTLFADALLVSDIPSIYDLPDKREDIVSLDGWSHKSADKLIDAINRARVSNEPAKLIYSLNIEGVGRHVSATIWNYIKLKGKNSIDELLSLSRDELLNLEGIGDKSSLDIVRSIKANSQLIIKMNSLVAIEEVDKPKGRIDSTFSGKRVCVTGSFKDVARKAIADFVEASGGTFMTSVSSRTDILVAGDKAGSKLDKAKKLGIEILDEIDIHVIMEL